MHDIQSDSYRRRYALIVCISLVLHVLLFILLFSQTPKSPPQAKISTVQVQLSRPKPKEPKPVVAEKKKEEQLTKEQAKPDKTEEPSNEKHAPRHTAEEFASNNQTDRSKNILVDGAQTKPKSELRKLSESRKTKKEQREKVEVAKRKEQKQKEDLARKDNKTRKSEIKQSSKIVSVEGSRSEVNKQREAAAQSILNKLELGTAIDKQEKSQLAKIDKLLGDVTSEGKALELEFDIEKDLERDLGNIDLLSDRQLANVEISDPFTEKESKQIQLVNRYLQRMQKQVMAVWKNPYKGSQMHRGVIRMELNPQGYLVDRFVYQTSGIEYLDQSVLDALDSIDRFLVPENAIIAERYYTNLRFFYSSIEEEFDLMPFEIKEK